MKDKYNHIALIYFSISWLIGILIIAGMILKISDDLVLTLIFLSAINLIINLISIVLLFAFIFIFPENRVQFKNSLVLMMFNFPILSFLYLISTI
ncbi:hypothetical protein [Chryseobacterium hispalense]|jgi:hypothetical protein|uniref:hypothetical protein n=1 Tax=Chryseobacterium hispalense TaxID=1453492 RepID=UPI0004936BCB|nr:hypothetical protein [Chryseobacterium hispalense]